ncbi:MAG: hypothetical protein HQL71_07895 [Magnetococcales bacterium]|nr:hypothetical protein [Magnetococcales bacterium]
MEKLNNLEVSALKQAQSKNGIDPVSMDDFYVTIVFPLIESGLLDSGFPIRITPKGSALLEKYNQVKK